MGPFEELANLDKLVHEPARLAILTALDACESADFLFLQRLTGLSKGNLSAHLTKLEGAGLIEVERRFVHKRPNTMLHITAQGRTAISRHWQRLDSLRSDIQGWRPDKTEPSG
jgi:DNA-binding MarR family transcriptional regulator